MSHEAYCNDQDVHEAHLWLKEYSNGYVGEYNIHERFCPGLRVRPPESTLRKLAVEFLSKPVTVQRAILRSIGVEPGPMDGPREVRDRMPSLLAQVRERGLIEEFRAAVAKED